MCLVERAITGTQKCLINSSCVEVPNRQLSLNVPSRDSYNTEVLSKQLLLDVPSRDNYNTEVPSKKQLRKSAYQTAIIRCA